MTSEEFRPLSEMILKGKSRKDLVGYELLRTKDVKESIKRLKEEIKKNHEEWINNWGADLISTDMLIKHFGKELVE